MKSDVSAFNIPTKVTLGKSSPLLIICVPNKISYSPRENAVIILSWLPFLVVVSKSILITLASGNNLLISSSIFSVPVPSSLNSSFLQSGQIFILLVA